MFIPAVVVSIDCFPWCWGYPYRTQRMKRSSAHRGRTLISVQLHLSLSISTLSSVRMASPRVEVRQDVLTPFDVVRPLV